MAINKMKYSKAQKQEEQRLANKATLELAEIGGYIEYATKLISLQYLVGSVVGLLSAELDIVFERCNIKSNKIISIQKGLDQTMDKYYKFFEGALGKDTTLDWAKDVDALEAELKKWAGIKTLRPKRKAMSQAKPLIEQKYNVKIKDTL